MDLITPSGGGGGGGGTNKIFLAINVYHRERIDLPSRGGSVPAFLKKPIATFDFPRGLDPAPTPLWISVHTVSSDRRLNYDLGWPSITKLGDF